MVRQVSLREWATPNSHSGSGRVACAPRGAPPAAGSRFSRLCPRADLYRVERRFARQPKRGATPSLEPPSPLPELPLHTRLTRRPYELLPERLLRRSSFRAGDGPTTHRHRDRAPCRVRVRGPPSGLLGSPCRRRQTIRSMRSSRRWDSCPLVAYVACWFVCDATHRPRLRGAPACPQHDASSWPARWCWS